MGLCSKAIFIGSLALFSQVTLLSYAQTPPSSYTDLTAFSSRVSDSAFISAMKAYQKGHLAALRELSKQIAGHPLHDYVQLWELLLALKHKPFDDDLQIQMTGFIATHQGDYLAERARSDYARIKAEYDDVKSFNELWPHLTWQVSEPDMQCHRAYITLLQKKDAASLSAAKQHLKATPSAHIEACKRLGDLVDKQDPKWAWAHLLTLLQQKRYQLAKILIVANRSTGRLPVSFVHVSDLLKNPSLWYQVNRRRFGKLNAHLLAAAALRFAPYDITKAVTIARAASARFTPHTRALVWGRIGYEAALRHDKNTLQYYLNAGKLLGTDVYTVNHDLILLWQARAALREHKWHRVLASIEKLSPPLQKSSVWTYWKGRALIATGKSKKGRPLLESLVQGTDFYSLLACDALAQPYNTGFTEAYEVLSEEKVQAFRRNPHLIRARAFYDLDLLLEGNREWNWAMKGLSSLQRLELAQYALIEEIPHRAIASSIGAKPFVRPVAFPRPYTDEIRAAAHQTQLPESWLFGLIRQESRFISFARSSVGAKGLMQVMPKTGKWVARRMDIPRFKVADLDEVDINVKIGAYYLRCVYDNFDTSVPLATAAYNAGPSRAQQWRSSLLSPIEAAIYVETIPFTETRDYVKKVTTNAIYYAQETDPYLRLTTLLGIVTPKGSNATSLP